MRLEKQKIKIQLPSLELLKIPSKKKENSEKINHNPEFLEKFY